MGEPYDRNFVSKLNEDYWYPCVEWKIRSGASKRATHKSKKAGKPFYPPNLQRMDSVMAALGLYYFSMAANLKQRFVIGK